MSRVVTPGRSTPLLLIKSKRSKFVSGADSALAELLIIEILWLRSEFGVFHVGVGVSCAF